MKKTWWKESVVYQIYPRSFCDSNGDGIGDLRGIIQKLDYLKLLGVSVVWLCPVYESPNADNGYDISNYRAIMAEFGTLADWEELLAGMHQRGIKLLMDLVLNHTSDAHPWFVAARQSKDNPYRDYYFWRPAHDGELPNNWESFFGGSAWEYDPTTAEYYLHVFSTRQPDLNWDNPKLRRDMIEMMTWWLDKGIDGFRLDAINMISKTPGLPDAPRVVPGPYQPGGQFFINGPHLIDYLQQMKQEAFARYDVFTVGETPAVTTAHAIALTGEDSGPLDMLFQFEHMDVDNDLTALAPKWSRKDWDLCDLKRIMTRWQVDLDGKGWNSIYLTNHDLPRAVSRFGNDRQYRVESAKLLATFLQMLQGTPFIFQGEEIGMTNVAFESIADYRDIDTLNLYKLMVEAGGADSTQVMTMIYDRGRDNARTPMQWDASRNAGFTTGTPWIGVNPNYTDINVASALADPDSIFYYYQKLLQLRRENATIVYGRYQLLLEDDPAIYAFTRTLDGDRLLVVLNFTANAQEFALPAEVEGAAATLLIGNYPVRADDDFRGCELRPFEARVYRIREA